MIALGFLGLAVSTPDARFEAVRHAVVNPPAGIDTPAEVDAWVNAKIAYRADARDEWAHPVKTLARGYGDCEDIALVKWAALRRYNPLFLIVRDGKAYHAVVIVKGRLLDSAGRKSMPAADARDYMPVTGWANGKRYIFGRPA